MPRRAHAALAALPIALIACGGPRIGARAGSAFRSRGPAPVAARAQFSPDEGDAVFQRAVRAAALDGYRVQRCNPDSRRLETTRIEFDAPCGATTCLARQTIAVALGYRMARVTVQREVYDGAAKTWRPERGRETAEAARELLGEIVSSSGIRRAGDPCAAAPVEVSALGAIPAGR